jgi:hypothetical protein
MYGGLVGPIFLLIYYVFETPLDRQYTQWMVIVGLIITIADVLIALIVANYSVKSAARRADLEQHGVLALGQITDIAETGTEINDRPLVKLALHIEGPGFAFDTQKRVIASMGRMGNLNKRQVVVLVDPATHDYEIDWERSPVVNGLVSARFTLSDDGQTYDLSGQAGPLMEILQLFKANNIPLSSPLDLRSNQNLALREELRAVVRRAVASQPFPASVAQPGAVSDTPGWTPPRQSAAQRLRELDSLRAMEVINEDEYAEKRRQIISEI